tara:strand:- start:885 stop:1895 length:1011 start_codon:yes stop_codon:yes gene_type:complete
MKITLAELKAIIGDQLKQEAEDYTYPKTGQGDSAIEDYHDMVMIRRLIHTGMQKSKLLKGERLDRWLGNFNRNMVRALDDIQTYEGTREKKFGPITYQSKRGLAAMEPKRGKEAEQEVKQLSGGRGSVEAWLEFYDLFYRAFSDLEKGLYDQADSAAATKEAQMIKNSFGREGLLAITGLGHKVPSGYAVLDNKDNIIRSTLGGSGPSWRSSSKYRRSKATPAAATKWQKRLSKVGMYEELRTAIAEILAEHDDYHSDEMFDIFAGDHPPPHSTAAEEEPDSYEKLTTAYHALEDVLGEYPHLQDAFDIVANVLDGLDTGDPMGRADESLKEDTPT